MAASPQHFVDVVRFVATSAGTVDFAVAAAVTGYQTPAAASAIDGRQYRYRAESTDLAQWEVGWGTYTVATLTLTRATVEFSSTGGGSKTNFTNAPQVAFVYIAPDANYMQNASALYEQAAFGGL